MEIKRLKEEVKTHSLSKEAVNILLSVLEELEKKDVVEVHP